MRDSKIEQAVRNYHASLQGKREEPTMDSEAIRDRAPEESRARTTPGVGTTVERAMFSAGGRLAKPVERSAPQHFGVPISEPFVRAGQWLEPLKANLWVRSPSDEVKAILLVGAASNVGTSTLAWDFASSLAQDARSNVLLMDADGGATKKHSSWSPVYERGIAAGITLEALLRLRTVSPPDVEAAPSLLYALPAGKNRPSPLALYRSSAFDQFLGDARQTFGNVLIDAPPISNHPETLVLAGKADGVILCVESERTTRRAATWARKQIEMAGGQLIGVVLTKRRYRIPSWLYQRM